MSKIDKLSILGVRSFDNQRSETIAFFSPLTLVVGYNGSGKTTIIECLKYATTGILPNNSKTGGAFIHDPRLCNEKEVMAQVKIQFKSSTGGKMVATRSLQLTVNKARRTQKSLEAHLLMEKNGERTAISSRVAELDQILPQYLGVSTAVLDNVIFCHQDDSLWPLSEPSVLKKKFDEIFEAQKYTKAIDNIKSIRKTHNIELGKYKVMEQHAKEDKDKAEKAQRRTEQLHDEVEVLRVKVTDLSSRMRRASELEQQARKDSEAYVEIIGQLSGKRIEARGKENTIKDLTEHLKEVPESDEWLQSTLDEFESRLEQYGARKESKQNEYLERKSQYEDRHQLLGKKQKLQGQHESEKADHERKLEHRKGMVREAATKHGLRGYDDLTDDALVDEFMFKIQKISRDQTTALDRARREADSAKQEARSLVNQLVARQSALRDAKESAKGQMIQNDREANEYQRKVNQISYDEGKKAAIESRMEELNNSMRNAKETAGQADWDARIKEANAELHAYEDDVSRFNHELIQGTKRSGEMAKLSHLKQELKERHRSLQTMLNTHTDRINKLIGTGWDARTVEQTHQAAFDEAMREAGDAEQNRDAVAREMEQVQFKQKTLRTDLSQKTRDMERYKQEVKTAIDDEPEKYHQILTQMGDNLDAIRQRSSNSEAMMSYFGQILDTANDHNPACRVCKRPFRANDPMLSAMKTRLTALVNREAQAVGENELKEAEAEHQAVVDAAIPLENWKRLKNIEIPTLEKELQQLTQQREGLVSKIEEHDKIVQQRQSAKKELEQMSRNVASIAKCQAEIGLLEMQIEEISSKSQHDGVRTLDDIQQDINNLTEKIRVSKKSVSQLTAEKDLSRMEISRMELDKSALQNDLNTAEYQLEKKASLLARVEEYSNSNQKQRDTLDKIDKDIDSLDPEISTAQAKYEDIAQRAETQERELSRTSSELGNSVNALNLLNTEIKSYLDRGGPSQLTSVNREIKRIEQDMKALEAEQNETSREINKIQEQLRDSETTRRQYADNLRYRQESRALEHLLEEIEELAAHNAEADRDRLQTEARKRGDEYTRLHAEQAGLAGEMKTKDNHLTELLADFETDFKDAPKRYKKAHIQVETTKAAVEDLARYAGALDKAIMKYHSLKMEEINRIIEELWQRTYQGTDVDTIMIKSGNESSVGGRSYNYRVVMVKQDAEMDMRGRCSAGQKVLASIIIRLALAECFGVNCGVIALDEPTTNLDQDNIRSLAESLHEIIKVRQAQSNFQLIVITHDEEFLRHMQCGDFADYYYRVSRNEKCNSIIERQGIAEVI